MFKTNKITKSQKDFILSSWCAKFNGPLNSDFELQTFQQIQPRHSVFPLFPPLLFGENSEICFLDEKRSFALVLWVKFCGWKEELRHKILLF